MKAYMFVLYSVSDIWSLKAIKTKTLILWPLKATNHKRYYVQTCQASFGLYFDMRIGLVAQRMAELALAEICMVLNEFYVL